MPIWRTLFEYREYFRPIGGGGGDLQTIPDRREWVRKSQVGSR